MPNGSRTRFFGEAVLSIEEARSTLPAILRSFRRGEAQPVVVGRHRRPEAVVLPVGRAEELMASEATGKAFADLVGGNREEILATARRRGATSVRVFGSVARGEETGDSDLDLLVEFESGRGLLALSGLRADLEGLLGREIDVVTPAGLRPGIRDRILAEAVPL